MCWKRYGIHRRTRERLMTFEPEMILAAVKARAWRAAAMTLSKAGVLRRISLFRYRRSFYLGDVCSRVAGYSLKKALSANKA